MMYTCLRIYKQKSQDPYALAPSGIAVDYLIRTKFDRAGDLPNLITHANVKSIDIKLWFRRRVSGFTTTAADAIKTYKPYRVACDY